MSISLGDMWRKVHHFWPNAIRFQAIESLELYADYRGHGLWCPFKSFPLTLGDSNGIPLHKMKMAVPFPSWNSRPANVHVINVKNMSELEYQINNSKTKTYSRELDDYSPITTGSAPWLAWTGSNRLDRVLIMWHLRLVTALMSSSTKTSATRPSSWIGKCHQ